MHNLSAHTNSIHVDVMDSCLGPTGLSNSGMSDYVDGGQVYVQEYVGNMSFEQIDRHGLPH